MAETLGIAGVPSRKVAPSGDRLRILLLGFLVNKIEGPRLHTMLKVNLGNSKIEGMKR